MTSAYFDDVRSSSSSIGGLVRPIGVSYAGTVLVSLTGEAPAVVWGWCVVRDDRAGDRTRREPLARCRSGRLRRALSRIRADEQRYQLLTRVVHVVVHDDVVELVTGGQLDFRGGEPALDDLGRLGAARGEAGDQFLPARRGQKDQPRLRQRLAHRARALEIDLEQHVLAFGQRLAH